MDPLKHDGTLPRVAVYAENLISFAELGESNYYAVTICHC